MSTARHVALALAGQRRPLRLPNGDYLVCCPVPSHGRGRGDHNPSLRLADGDTRLLVRCYGGCDARDVLDVLRRRGLLDGTPARSPPPSPARSSPPSREGNEATRLRRIRRARELWHAARDPRGTLAEAYLCLRRLTLDDDLAGHVLRFHARCPWRDEITGRTEYLPALIAAFRSIDDHEITGIHRIALKPDGHKLGKKMLGVVHRAAVMLDYAGVSGELTIGEGVETCLAARLFGIRPTWALGSAGGIAHFPVLSDVRTLRIIGENDRTSEEAIELCGQRWQTAGRRVRVIRPTDDCNDIADVLEGRVR